MDPCLVWAHRALYRGIGKGKARDSHKKAAQTVVTNPRPACGEHSARGDDAVGRDRTSDLPNIDIPIVGL